MGVVNKYKKDAGFFDKFERDRKRLGFRIPCGESNAPQGAIALGDRGGRSGGAIAGGDRPSVPTVKVRARL